MPRSATRRRSLVLRDLGEETLVYDLDSHRASCLNREAAAVFYACDGHRSHEEIAALVTERLGRDVDADYVALAIHRLVGSSLLDGIPGCAGQARRAAPDSGCRGLGSSDRHERARPPGRSGANRARGQE